MSFISAEHGTGVQSSCLPECRRVIVCFFFLPHRYNVLVGVICVLDLIEVMSYDDPMYSPGKCLSAEFFCHFMRAVYLFSLF